MMTFMIAMAVLGVLVFVHEFGHFVVAKISGMRVEQFSIGMGPRIASIRKGETEYLIGAIPAGGYVSVTGASSDMNEDDDLDADDPRRYPNRPILHRALFAAAGPFMNIITTILLLMVIYMVHGVMVPQQDSVPIISAIDDQGAAANSGLAPGDKITMVGEVSVSGWHEVDREMAKFSGGTLRLEVERDGVRSTHDITPVYIEDGQRYLIGVTKDIQYDTETLGFQEAGQQSLMMTARMSTVILDSVKNLVTGKANVSDAEEGLAGPVGIVKVIDQSAQQGFWNVVMLTAVISVNFGLINLLPIPALDGSKLVFLALEAIRGKPISPEKEGIVNFIGFAFLMFLMLYVTYNDIARLIQ